MTDTCRMLLDCSLQEALYKHQLKCLTEVTLGIRIVQVIEFVHHSSPRSSMPLPPAVSCLGSLVSLQMLLVTPGQLAVERSMLFIYVQS